MSVNISMTKYKNDWQKCGSCWAARSVDWLDFPKWPKNTGSPFLIDRKPVHVFAQGACVSFSRSSALLALSTSSSSRARCTLNRLNASRRPSVLCIHRYLTFDRIIRDACLIRRDEALRLSSRRACVEIHLHREILRTRQFRSFE